LTYPPANQQSLEPTLEVHPLDVPLVPQPQEPFLPKASKSRLQAIVNLFPPGQFLRYLGVGGFNTLFGYSTAAGILFLLNHHAPARYAYLTTPAASILSTPLNITVAYFGYKFFVFKTKGNYLVEWLRTFAVYGTGMIPGLLALSAVTRFFQSALHLQHAAGYLALALIQGLTTIYSFVGHKKFSFKPAKTV
jgi:putative flippase GtrA